MADLMRASRTEAALGRLRLKGLAKSTPERLRIEELDRLLAEHNSSQPD